jgi:hypothetical protein
VTPLAADVEDVKKPAVWLLGIRNAPDAHGRGGVLELTDYRGIQPIGLERYFAAIGSRDPDRALGEYMKTCDAGILVRAIKYVDGGYTPWPLPCNRTDEPDFNGATTTYHERFVPDLRRLLNHRDPRVRMWSTAVLASLAEIECLDDVRRALDDPNPDVRAVACCLLAKWRDAASEARLSVLGPQIKWGFLADEFVAGLTAWAPRDEALILIQFLQTDGRAGRSFQDRLEPDIFWNWDNHSGPACAALRAQARLKEITGATFPLDVKLASRTWELASSASDDAGRNAILKRTFGTVRPPFHAEIAGWPEHGVARVTNVSDRDVWLCHTPGLAGSFSAEVNGRESFVLVRPGQTYEITNTSDGSSCDPPGDRTGLNLYFDRNGNEFGIDAWMGKLTVYPGSHWHAQHGDATGRQRPQKHAKHNS